MITKDIYDYLKWFRAKHPDSNAWLCNQICDYLPWPVGDAFNSDQLLERDDLTSRLQAHITAWCKEKYGIYTGDEVTPFFCCADVILGKSLHPNWHSITRAGQRIVRAEFINDMIMEYESVQSNYPL